MPRVTAVPKTQSDSSDFIAFWTLWRGYQRGIADVIGIDDSNFELAISKAEPVKHGAVKITLEVA